MKYSVIFALILALSAAGCNKHESISINPIPSPAPNNSELPFLTSDQSQNVFLSWVEPAEEDSVHKLRYAAFEDGAWSEPQTITASSSWFINWADYPSITAQNKAVVAAHALHKKPGNKYSYDVHLFLKNDGAWSKPLIPHTDGTATEHGFVSLAPWNGQTFAIWLDGRRTANRTDEEYFDMKKAMTLRSAIIGPEGTVTQKALIDSTVCDCCNTSLALAGNSAIAAYRNRTGEEVRDIYISRFNGTKWSDPKSIHEDGWKIAACPVNGPSIAATNSRVAVAWYTAANGNRTVKAAISKDNGKSFSEPIIISDKNPIGRIKTVTDSKGNAFVSWMEKTDSNTVLKLKRIAPDMSVSKGYDIAEMDGSRKSGFPQMTLGKNELIFAWTQIDSTTSVQTAAVSLPLN